MDNFMQVKEGYALVRTTEDFGSMTAISKEGEPHIPVVPLDGWRGRNLAESLLGERDAGLWELGVAKLVKAQELKDLPGWDGANTAYLQKFTGVVCIEVVCVNQGYGVYIAVTQMGAAADIRYWKQQEDMLAARLATLGVHV